MSKITETLKEAAKDVLTEETLQAIEQVFNEQVDVKVDERSKIAVTAALNEQDEKYATKLEALLEAIDKDHCRKLERVVESLDTDRTNKLKRVIKKYHLELNTEAVKLRDTVVGSVSDYLDSYIDEAIPTSSIQEAVANKKAYSLLEGFRKTLGVDLALANETIREGVVDGKKQLDESNEQLKITSQQRNTLAEEVAELKKTIFLSEKTKNFDKKKTNFITKTFKGKDIDFIQENFKYTVKMFDKKENEALDILKEDAISKSEIKNEVKQELTTESTDVKNPYISELSRIM
tara:strand:+ start:23872 stop:24744 length:873 start_codon:yes stop_codon:yes gene_type:complete